MFLEDLEREAQFIDYINSQPDPWKALLLGSKKRPKRGRPRHSFQQKQSLTRRFMELRRVVEAEAQQLRSRGDSRPVTNAYEIVAQRHRFSTPDALRVQIWKYTK